MIGMSVCLSVCHAVVYLLQHDDVCMWCDFVDKMTIMMRISSHSLLRAVKQIRSSAYFIAFIGQLTTLNACVTVICLFN